MLKRKISNVNDLRDRLIDVFEEVESGAMSVKTAKELANVAGKMIGSTKVQLEYHALRKEAPKIKFLHVEDKI